TEDWRELLRFLAGDDPLKRLFLTERDAVEEPQCARHLIDVRPRVLLVDKFELVGADVLHAQPIRWTIEMPAELRDRVDVGLLRRAREIADRHVLNHTLTKRADRSHLGLLS